MQYLDEDPGSKIIIFSQFVQYIELCSIFLRRKGVQHVTYVGSMKQHEREAAVQEFTNAKITEDSPRVMIISLKCGGGEINPTLSLSVLIWY
jgi:SNF2 family DNA or RNA helicase